MKFISEEYMKNFFDYGIWLAKSMWNKKILEAKKQFGVWFDLENNDTKKQQRDIIIPQNRWETSNCKFKCEMYSAGGDWEYRVIYFRCQLVDGYAFNLRKYGDAFFVFIPNKEQGNHHLVMIDKGATKGQFRAPHDGEHEYDPKTDENPNENKCWDSLKKYLTSLVEEEIKNMDKGEEL